MNKKLKKYAVIGCAIFIIVLTIRSCSIRRLPVDQVMIDDFNAHKHEFMELVKIYGEFDGFGSGPLDFAKRPDVSELKLKTGVGHITGGVGGIWLDDPYSVESAKVLEELYQSKKYSYRNFRKMALIEMADVNKYSAVYFFNGGYNWKDYVYIPVDPQIIQGRVRLPGNGVDGNEPLLWLRVLDSLDSPKWKRGECVLRKIEPMWFLSRCRAN